MADVADPVALVPLSERRRTGCLTAYLVLTMIGGAIGLLMYTFAADLVRKAVPTLPAWAIPVSIFQTIIGLVCAVGIWRWRRWGVYGYVALTVVGVITNLLSGQGVLKSMLGFVGTGILLLLVRPNWAQMED